MHTCKKRVEIVMLLFSLVTNFSFTIDTRVPPHIRHHCGPTFIDILLLDVLTYYSEVFPVGNLVKHFFSLFIRDRPYIT